MNTDVGRPPPAESAAGRHRRPLFLAFALTASILVVEAALAVFTGSLALLSDAGHMLTDVVGLGMALAAVQIAGRPDPAPHRTFGLYRAEILAALANAFLLVGIAGYVMVVAVRRLFDPVDVDGVPVLAVAVVGLAANVVSLRLLQRGARESLNLRGAFLEVFADTIGSVGVIFAAIVLMTTGWPYVDPIVGLAIGSFIVPRAWRLASQALRILVQAAPPAFDLDGLAAKLAALPGVVDVHDLHVWTLTSDMEVATAHLMVERAADSHLVLDGARDLLGRDFGISHGTFQVEPDDHTGCSEQGW